MQSESQVSNGNNDARVGISGLRTPRPRVCKHPSTLGLMSPQQLINRITPPWQLAKSGKVFLSLPVGARPTQKLTEIGTKIARNTRKKARIQPKTKIDKRSYRTKTGRENFVGHRGAHDPGVESPDRRATKMLFRICCALVLTTLFAHRVAAWGAAGAAQANNVICALRRCLGGRAAAAIDKPRPSKQLTS